MPLAALKPTALRGRARAAGVADEDIEVAEDDDDEPKVAVIELIVAVAQKPDDALVDTTVARELSRQKWNILVQVFIFYLCNGCSIKNF